MGASKIIFAFLAALAAVNIIFAEEAGYSAPDQAEAFDEKTPNKENKTPEKPDKSPEKPDKSPEKPDKSPEKPEPISRDFNNCTNYCINCRQALQCTYRGGSVRKCHGRYRYCVTGRCSFYPTKECSFE